MRHFTSAPQQIVARFIANQATPIGMPAWGSSRFLTLVLVALLLLWPGMIGAEGLKIDLPSTPIHLEAASANSVEAQVDLGDPTKFPFSSEGKWKGYLEFLGKPGTERSLGQPDLFLPLLQDKNDMTFFNLRGQLQFDNTDVHEYNIGLGHRHMFKEWILGGYGYYDKRHTQLGNSYNQFTGGLEAMSVDWAFRANGYLPENKTATSTTADTNATVIRPGDQIKVAIGGLVQEKPLPGVDGEVGYLLPIPWKAYTAVFDETRVYAGGYHFFGEDQFESVTGPRGRVEWRAYDLPFLGPGSRFMMGVEAQWDEPRGSQAFGLASLRIPFDVFSDKSKRKALKGLDRRMLQPVIRDVDVVTSEVQNVTVITGALNQAGHTYTQVVEVDAADEVTLQAAITANTAGTPLIVPKNNGGEVSLTGSLTLEPNQTLAGADGTVRYETPWLSGSIGHGIAGAAAGFQAISGMTTMIDMGPGSEVNGLTLDANNMSNNGLWVNENAGSVGAGTRYVANSTILNTPQAGNSNGVRAQGTGTVFRIVNTRITDGDGDFGDSGVRAQNGATVYISHSTVANNGAYGIRADNEGSLIVADNMLIENNGQNSPPNNTSGAGVAVFGGGTVRITDSVVRGNVDGLEAGTNSGQPTSTIIADGLLITDSVDDGVYHWGSNLSISNSRIQNNGDDGVQAESVASFGDPPATTTLTNVMISGNGTIKPAGVAVESFGDSTITIIDSDITGDLVVDCDTSASPPLNGTIIVDGVPVPDSGKLNCP